MRKLYFILGLSLLFSCNPQINYQNLAELVEDFIDGQNEFLENCLDCYYIIDPDFIEVNDHYKKLIENTLQDKKYELALKKLHEGEFDPSFIIKKTSRILVNDESISNVNIAGIFSVSRVYFDRESNLGLFFITFNCKSDCGYTAIIFVKVVEKSYDIIESNILTIF